MASQLTLKERIAQRAKKKIPNNLLYSDRVNSNRDIRQKVIALSKKPRP